MREKSNQDKRGVINGRKKKEPEKPRTSNLAGVIVPNCSHIAGCTARVEVRSFVRNEQYESQKEELKSAD